jgi:Zn-dependent protease with chaperone function
MRRNRSLIDRYRAAALFLLGLGVIAAWPALLGPLGRLYVIGCRMLLDGLPVGHHYPPLLVALLAPATTFVIARALVELARQVAGHRRLDRRLRARQSKGTRLADCVVTTDLAVFAFCGGLLRPRIYLSRGLLEILDGGEAEAVLAHERHHLRRRDPLRFFVTNVLTLLAPVFPALIAFERWVHIRAELAADRAALECQAPEVLASALLKVMRSNWSAAPAGPGAGLSPTDARISALLGRPARFNLPASDLLVSLLTAAALTTTAVWLTFQTLPNPPACPTCPAF